MGVLEKSLKNFINWESEENGAFKEFFIKLRPNVLFRYKPVLDFIKKRELRQASILEVGSGSLGITRYLKQEVAGVDIDFSGPRSSYLKRISCSAMEMPFEDTAFDFVVSLDVLEHLSPTDRKKVISEMLRVARRYVIVGCPCGKDAEKWEQRARGICERKISKCSREEKKTDLIHRSSFLKEHLENGLPSESETIDSIKNSLRNLNCRGTIKVITYQSVWVWYMLALSSIRISNFRWLFTTILATGMFPILWRVKWGGYYRKLFIVDKMCFDS